MSDRNQFDLGAAGPAEWQHREEGSRRQLRLMRWIGLRAPDWLTGPIIWAVSLYFSQRLERAATRGSTLFLTRVLGRAPTWRERHRHARMFAHVFLERTRLLAGGLDDFAINEEGGDLVRALVAEGKGGVLLGAHYGSFEALRAFDRGLNGLIVNYLMHPAHAQGSTRLLNELNPEVAQRVIVLSDGPAALIAAKEALERGEWIAILGDRLPESATRSRLHARFWGEDIALPNSPYVLAMAMRVPLIFCAARRLGRRRYEIEFKEIHDGSPVPRAERGARMQAMAEIFAAHLERLTRRDPYNWFNFFDIWRG
ncbi:MAG: hypothetical protein MRY63_10645 [Neomegalonema sp.]|nr:hypothetical protein [Neomegalonema sp.]